MINFTFKNNKNNPIKMIVFDFDNTLYLDEDHFRPSIKYLNIEEYNACLIKLIQEIRKSEIIIIINTGRSYFSFKNTNVFPYDYLICNNGSEIYNNNDKLLKYYALEGHDIEIIKNCKLLNNCEIKKYYPKNKENSKIVTAFSLINNNKHEFNQIVNYFINNLKNVNVFYKYPKIRLVNAKTNKLKSLTYLMDKCNIKAESVRAIGDDDNDYEMLKRIKSSTLIWQSDKIKKLKLNSYNNVIDYLLNLE